MSFRFTELTVKALPLGKHFDATTPAFGMRVGKNRRTWIVQRGVDRRIIRVGHYPAMTLAEARTKGKQLLAATLLNHERVTFQEAYDLFEKIYLPAKSPAPSTTINGCSPAITCPHSLRSAWTRLRAT